MNEEIAMSEDTTELLERIAKIAAEGSLEEIQESMVRELARNLPDYDWVGIYKVDRENPSMLLLGAFVGEPTPHVKIPVTQGICGAAVLGGATIIVDDVNADPRYLSCSIKTKSEIVVPIRVHGKIVGELDIDSHKAAAFGQKDREFLERCAEILARAIEQRQQLWL